MDGQEWCFVLILTLITMQPAHAAKSDDERWMWFGVFLGIHITLVIVCFFLINIPILRYYRTQTSQATQHTNRQNTTRQTSPQVSEQTNTGQASRQTHTGQASRQTRTGQASRQTHAGQASRQTHTGQASRQAEGTATNRRNQPVSNLKPPGPPKMTKSVYYAGGYDKVAHLVPTDWSLDVENLTIVDITNDSDDIKNLVASLWFLEQNSVSKGRDVLEQHDHIYINITKVERIQNVNLYRHYLAGLDQLGKKTTLQSLETLLKEKGFHGIFTRGLPDRNMHDRKSSGVATTDTIQTQCESSALNTGICHYLNEHVLFHGTKSRENVLEICETGLSPFYSKGGKQMYGKGVYFSDNPVKADQYTDEKSLSHEDKTQLLVRVALGDVFVTSSSRYNEIEKPVCKECQRCCDIQHHELYDSTVIVRENKFREFVVYRDYQCYPEYIITYNRTRTQQ